MQAHRPDADRKACESGRPHTKAPKLSSDGAHGGTRRAYRGRPGREVMRQRTAWVASAALRFLRIGRPSMGPGRWSSRLFRRFWLRPFRVIPRYQVNPISGAMQVIHNPQPNGFFGVVVVRQPVLQRPVVAYAFAPTSLPAPHHVRQKAATSTLPPTHNL